MPIVERVAARGSAVGIDGLVSFFVAVGLVVVFPWLVIGGLPDGGRNGTWVLCLAIAAWSGLRLALIVGSGAPRLFTLSFWLYCYLFMGVAPAAQIRADEMASTTPRLDPALDLPTFAVVVLGIVAFEIGSLLRGRGASSTAVAPHPDASVAAASSSVTRGLWLLAAVTPVVALFVLRIGPATLFSSREEFALVANERFDETVLPVVRAIAWVPALVVLHRIISRRRDHPEIGLSGPERLGIAVAVAALVFANNPLTSSRYAFGSMALSLAVLGGGLATDRRARRTMLAVIIGFVVLFPIADAFRLEETGGFGISLRDEYAGNPDYDSFGQISNALTVVADNGFSFLTQAFGVLLFFVPRSLWTDKPFDTGVYLARERGYDFENLSAPLWSELFVIGGHATVALGFLALGYVIAAADRRLIDGVRGRRQYSVAAAFMPFYLIILLRGSLLQAMALMVALGAAVWLTRPAAWTARRPELGTTERTITGLAVPPSGRP